MRSTLLVLSLTLGVGSAIVAAQDAASAHSVEYALQSFRLADPNLHIEVAAAEPDVVDPVCVTWDEDGRMFAVEMRDYPSGAGGGTIRLLVDSDSDGYYETSTVFADGLSFPSSAVPWNGGIIVAAAPDLIFLKDGNGDGVADERRTLFTGFGQGLPHDQVNSLYWGSDLWIYGSNGGSDGTVSALGSATPVSLTHRDFRLRPDIGVIEAVPGFSQSGACDTEFGDRLLSLPTSPFRQTVLGQPTPGLVEDVSILEWFEFGRIWPISIPQKRFGPSADGYFLAARGLSCYVGDVTPKYKNNAFVCEPLGNLVHRRVLTQRGSVLAAKRGESGFEFLASSDERFRPVNVATGPDGALYIVDFCRQYVEHSSLAPENERESIAWRSGDTMGRIWRVRPKAWNRSSHKPPTLSGASSEELANSLRSTNGWVRRQAQRLLVERKAVEALPTLEAMAAESDLAESKAAALFTMGALGNASKQAIETALADKDPGVRSVAVVVAQSKFSTLPELVNIVQSLTQDSDLRVRRAVAIAAVSMPAESRVATCKTLAIQAESDQWLTMAIMESAGPDAWPLLESVFAARSSDLDWWVARRAEFVSGLAEKVGASGKQDEVGAFLALLAAQRPVTGGPDVIFLSGLSRGLQRSGTSLRQVLSSPPATLDAAATLALGRAFETADALAHHNRAGLPLRQAAVRLLVERPDGSGMETLLALLKPDERPEIVNAVVSTLGQGGGADTNVALLARWSGLSKDVRGQLVEQFASAPAQTATLLDAIDQGTVLKHEIALKVRKTLLDSTDPAIHDRALALYPEFSSAAKADLYAQYSQAIHLPADAARGAKVFSINCFPCHQMHGIGNTVGPELSIASGKAKEELMRSILDPSAEVLPEFISYTIATKNFEDYAGLLAKEDASSVTLRAAGGMEQTVQRSDIETIAPGSGSLMPEGLEAAFDIQGLADLIEFIRNPAMDALKQAVSEVSAPPL
ncbi:MAG: c-type cytochrome [Candidatus Hydrogenedentes bacterium]|nr:c-type cytochrome [Candidatus Hydrogenedentota bacterium]